MFNDSCFDLFKGLSASTVPEFGILRNVPSFGIAHFGIANAAIEKCPVPNPCFACDSSIMSIG